MPKENTNSWGFKGLLRCLGPLTLPVQRNRNTWGKLSAYWGKNRQTQEWSTHIFTHYPSLCVWPVRGTSGKSAPAKLSLMMLRPFVNCQSGHLPSIINAVDFNTALGTNISAFLHISLWFHEEKTEKTTVSRRRSLCSGEVSVSVRYKDCSSA